MEYYANISFIFSQNQQTISIPTRGGIHACVTPSSTTLSRIFHTFFSQKTRPAEAQHCNYAGDFLHRISEFQKPPVIQTQVAFFRAVMGFVVMGWWMICVPCAINLCQIALNTHIETHLLIHKRNSYMSCCFLCHITGNKESKAWLRQLNSRGNVTIETQNIDPHSQAILTSTSSLYKQLSNKNTRNTTMTYFHTLQLPLWHHKIYKSTQMKGIETVDCGFMDCRVFYDTNPKDSTQIICSQSKLLQ